MVELLNRLYVLFDDITDMYRVYKVRSYFISDSHNLMLLTLLFGYKPNCRLTLNIA